MPCPTSTQMAVSLGSSRKTQRFRNAETKKREYYSPLSIGKPVDVRIKPWNPFSMMTVDQICAKKAHECSPLNYNLSQSVLDELDDYIDIFDLEISETDFQYEKVLCMKLQLVSQYFGFRFVIELPGKMLICTTCRSLLKNNYRKCPCLLYDFDIHSLINLLEPDFAICIRGELEPSIISLKEYETAKMMKNCLGDQCEVSLISHGCIEENDLEYPSIDHQRVLMPILQQAFKYVCFYIEIELLIICDINTVSLVCDNSTDVVGWKSCISIWYFGNLPPPTNHSSFFLSTVSLNCDE